MSENVVAFRRLEIPQPKAIDAEQALIGACLHDAGAFDVASDIVQGQNFSEPVHQTIWNAMAKGRAEGRTLDFRLVAASLGPAGDAPLADLGLSVGQYVAQLASSAVSVKDAPHFARAIVDASHGRKLSSVTMDLHEAISGGTIDTSAVATDAIEKLDAVVQSRSRTSTPRLLLGTAAANALEASRIAGEGKTPPGLPTGLRSLDRAISGGLRSGKLYVVAGRPGMGKTMAALEIGKSVARSGSGVLFISLEMDDRELAERCIASEVARYERRLPYQDIATGHVPREMDGDLGRALEALEAMPFVIEQQPGLTMGQIGARARQARTRMERQGIRLGLVITDHMGLVAPSPAYRGNRTAEITEISNAHKALAKDLGIPVVMLCQLNRQVEQRDDKRPNMSDLRDSGAIEQDADCIIFPFREAYYLAKQKEPSAEDILRLQEREFVMEIHIAKNRGGPETRFDAYCDPATNVVCSLGGAQ